MILTSFSLGSTSKECSNVASPLPLCIERDTAAIVSTQSHAFHLSEEAADTSIWAERKRGSSGIFKGRAAHAKCNSEALSDYSHVGPGLKICGGTAKLRVSSGECSTVRTLCRFCYLVSVWLLVSKLQLHNLRALQTTLSEAMLCTFWKCLLKNLPLKEVSSLHNDSVTICTIIINVFHSCLSVFFPSVKVIISAALQETNITL